MAKKRNN